MSGAKGKVLWVSSGYGYKTREPFVNVTVPGGEQMQMSIADALDHAANVVRAAEAAVQDAFMIEWAKEKLGIEDAGAAGLLNEYRLWREKRQL